MFVKVNDYSFMFECNTPHFRSIVAHTFTGSYLLKAYGAHYRKSLRIHSKVLSAIIFKTACRYLKWKFPPTAPPKTPVHSLI